MPAEGAPPLDAPPLDPPDPPDPPPPDPPPLDAPPPVKRVLRLAVHHTYTAKAVENAMAPLDSELNIIMAADMVMHKTFLLGGHHMTNGNSNSNANANSRVTAGPANVSRGPVHGEVRLHKRSGLMYIWEFVPGTEKFRWMRLDTYALGLWRVFPRRFAKTGDLRRPNRARMGLQGDGPVFARIEFD